MAIYVSPAPAATVPVSAADVERAVAELRARLESAAELSAR